MYKTPLAAAVIIWSTTLAGAAPSASRRAVWVSVAASDVPRLMLAGLAPAPPLIQSADVAAFELPEDELPRLSRFMHETFGRCGGFFAHRSRQEAQAAMPAAPAVPGGPYTIDQQSRVQPLLPRVRETEIRGTIETLAAYHTRFYKSQTGVDAARWLGARWQALAAGVPGVSVQLIDHKGYKQQSVVLTIPGTDAGAEVVILGGHLDSINESDDTPRAPGADDNASGIAVITESLRVLAGAGFRPRKTVQFIGYAAEEVGLWGSQDIAERYAGEGRKVAGVIQFDMTNFKGAADDIYILADNVDPQLTSFLEKLIDSYLGGKRSSVACGYACSDHASWTQSGFPAAAVFESSVERMNRAIHSSRDTLAQCGGTAEHSVKFAKLAVAFAVEMAKW